MFAVDVERQKGIARLINEITGVKVVWNYQNIKEPNPPFIGARLVNTSPDLMKERSYRRGVLPEDETEVFEVNRTIQEYTLYLKFKGVGANSGLKDLSCKMALQVYRDKLTADAGFSYIGNEGTKDITALQDSKYLEMANLDLTLRTTKKVEALTYDIENVTFSYGG